VKNTETIVEYITPRQVAERFNLKVDKLAKWRELGVGPDYYNPYGRTILYKPCEVDLFIQCGKKKPLGL